MYQHHLNIVSQINQLTLGSRKDGIVMKLTLCLDRVAFDSPPYFDVVPVFRLCVHCFDIKDLFANVEQVKFVYNFHAYGNMFVTPFNSMKDNILDEAYPRQALLFEEILEEAETPEGLKVGTAGPEIFKTFHMVCSSIQLLTLERLACQDQQA